METTRRAFLSEFLGAAASLLASDVSLAAGPADLKLRIGKARIEVAPGHLVETTTYNGSGPAPLVRLHEGVPVAVEITNATDLPEYVHWHGLPVAADIDGTEEEKSLVVPLHGTLRYRLTPLAPGSRWVHSHAMAMNDLTRGIYSGQFGFVYVEPKSNPGHYDQEFFLATHEWEPFFTEADEEMGQGEERFGETDWGPSMVEVGYRIRSINGKALGHGEPIRVREGERVLFHILNASATENIALALPAHEFLVLALDGNPVPEPHRVKVLELGAAERVDVIVEMTNPGVWILGSTNADDRGAGLGVFVEYAGKKGMPDESAWPASDWDYTLFGRETAALPPPDETIPMVIERIPPTPETKGLERWTINGRSFKPSDAPRRLEKGARYRLVFDNRSGDAHPLHLHRHTFELVKVNGKATAGVRKDVVVVKPYETVEVDFRPTMEGLTLFHCHQQLHMDQGFKTLFDVR